MDRTDTDVPDIDADDGDPQVDRISDSRKIGPDQLRGFIELIDAVPYWWHVARKELLFVGTQAAALFGFPLEAWQDSSFWHSRVHPEDLTSTLADYDAGLRQRRDVALEYRFRVAGGDWLWIRDSVRFVETPEGLCAIGTMVDITPHKHIEQALSASEERYRALVETANLIPYAYDIDEDRVTYIGPQAAKLLGYSLERWNPHRFWDDYMHPDDRDRVESTWDEASSVGYSGQIEYRLVCKDGRTVWVSDVSSVVNTAAGTRTACGFLIDVTDRRIAEQLVRDREDLLRSLVEAIPASINVKDLDGRYRLVNQAYARRHGRTADELLGRAAEEIFDAEHAERMAALAHSALQSGQATEFQERVHRRADGKGDVWLTSKVPLKDANGCIRHIAGIALDITDRKRAERALHASEERYRRFIESANASPHTFDLTSMRFTYVGPQFTRMFGYPVERLTDHESWISLIHPDDRAAAVSASVLGKSELIEHTNEYRMIAADGRIVWVREYCVNETYDDGRRIEYGLVFDISREKSAEQALRDSEAKYRAIVEDQTEFVVRFGPGGVMSYMNPAYCRHHGLTERELLGRSWYEFLPDADLPVVAASLAQITADNPIAAIEHRTVLPNGEIRWENWMNRGIFDRDGRTLGYQAVGRDITDRKLAEERMQESERRFRHLVESTDVVPYTMDVQTGRFTYVGPQAFRLLGYAHEEWSDEQFWESILHPDERDRMLEQWNKIKSIIGDECQEYRVVRKDGSVIWIRDVIRLELDPLGRKVAYGLMLDITDNKQREEQLRQAQKMDIVGQMTGGVAHDFNNLLTVIIGNLHLLGPVVRDNPAATRRLNLIKGAAERGAELTKGLLAFARRQTLQGKLTNVNSLVSGMSELLRRTLGEGIQIDLDLSEDLWPTVVDPAQMESVLVNLAVNARDAMGSSGSLHIETSNRLVDVGDGEHRPFIMLAVGDSGCGMSPEVLGKVFEPFFTTKPVGQGTGLGLSMVYGTVKQSGGRLEIESEVGKGTTVRIYLPRAETATAAAQAPAIAVEPAPGSATILLVEPDADGRKAAASILADLGHRVTEADGGSAALSVLESAGDSIDLMITNLSMPGNMSGVVLAHEATRRLPQLKVLFCSVPVPGAQDQQWVLKPYAAADLASKVGSALMDGRRT